MNGYRWKSAATELAEVVRSAGSRVALGGLVMMVLVAAPVVLRAYIFLPW